MATIQIRELPEDTYEVIRRRARRASQSIQAYMRDQVIALASTPTKEEALVAIEEVLDRFGGRGALPATVADEVAAERR